MTWLDVVDELGGENPWLMPRRRKCPLDRRGVEGERPHSLSAFARQTDQRPGDDRRTTSTRGTVDESGYRSAIETHSHA